MSSNNKAFIERLIQKIPRVGSWRAAFLKHSTPGHYYSPIPDIESVRAHEKLIFDTSKHIAGIDMHAGEQLSLLEEIGKLIKDYPYRNASAQGDYRYTEKDNIYFLYHDAATLFALMRHWKPKRIIEVGSGYSSALMLDTNEHFLGNSVELTFIEPYPGERLTKLMRSNDNCTLKKEFIQDIKPEFFKQLQAGDILFVDSSHVSKVNSDLNYILFEILPELNPGVYIHFHDVHYPFEYPKEWIYKGYAWNESYLLRSFLMYNTRFEIVFMNTFLSERHPSQYYKAVWPFGAEVKKLELSESGSLWIVKK